MNRDNDRQTSIILAVLGILPIVWLGLLIAPSVKGGLPEILPSLMNVMSDPFHIELCEDSVKTVLVLLLCYGMGIGIYFSTRRNYRRREEHGSAKWGNAKAVDKKYRQNPPSENKLMTHLTAYAIHKFFQERDFVYVHTPLITGSDCEGAGEMFQVTTMDLNNIPKTEQGGVDFSQDFFGKQTNLTVSGQLNGETFAQAFRNIYTFGPTFRAENSNTTRHAAEFWMIEPEIAFADLKDDMILAESMLKYVIRYVMENAPDRALFRFCRIGTG